MYKGDRARKENLVNYGFRLPSALDNRPLRFDEFERLLPQTIFVSATPADYERTHAGQVVEQVVRPTGLVDPVLEVRPAQTQVDDLLSEIGLRVEKHERVLVTTLTKRMAEDLTDYLNEHGVKVRYLHSDIDTVERVEIIRDLRLGEFDVLVGINLLREGLDIPEVSLVAILDADKEGFLRAERSLIQTIGRAARHINGMAILYADKMTDSMKAAIGETERRRAKQIAWNEKMGITPIGVQKRIKDLIDGMYDADEGKKQLKAAQTQGEVRGDAREGPGARAEAAREGDARRREESRVREGGRSCATALPAQGSDVRRAAARRDVAARARFARDGRASNRGRFSRSAFPQRNRSLLHRGADQWRDVGFPGVPSALSTIQLVPVDTMSPLPLFTRLLMLVLTFVCSIRMRPRPWSTAVNELCRFDRMRLTRTCDVPDVLSSACAASERVDSRTWRWTVDVPDAATPIAVFPMRVTCERTRSIDSLASAPADAVMPPLNMFSKCESVILSDPPTGRLARRSNRRCRRRSRRIGCRRSSLPGKRPRSH